jgi:pimeloyl-ACP methyl ester carboxylesterase
MATFVLIPGAGDSAWAWDLVGAELRERGHDVVAVDLPADDESAGLAEYTDTVVEAIGGRSDGLVLVAHSLGAFTAPLVCERVPVDLIVFVAGLIPVPGETASDWWSNTGYSEAPTEHYDDEIELYLHDVPPALAAEALANGRDQAAKPTLEPWPLERWPDVPTRYLIGRDDRLLPTDWIRKVVRERLGIETDEIDGGHCVYLSRPAELAERLTSFASGQ